MIQMRPILVYALQDSQSDSAFILDIVADKLSTRSDAINLRVSTMTTTSTIKWRRIKNKQVRGFYSTKFITIPTTYIREDIPMKRSHIPTSDTAVNWPHLRCLSDKIPVLQNCEVGMLNGYNCSMAITPRYGLSGKEDEPYGIKTHLGWSIVGATNIEDSNDVSCNFITTVPDHLKLESNHTNSVHYTLKTSFK